MIKSEKIRTLRYVVMKKGEYIHYDYKCNGISR